jgi:hypothetical protein
MFQEGHCARITCPSMRRVFIRGVCGLCLTGRGRVAGESHPTSRGRFVCGISPGAPMLGSVESCPTRGPTMQRTRATNATLTCGFRGVERVAGTVERSGRTRRGSQWRTLDTGARHPVPDHNPVADIASRLPPVVRRRSCGQVRPWRGAVGRTAGDTHHRYP